MQLRLEGVSVGHGGRALLTDVGFTIARGEIACLLGPSGSGKTTLLRAIAGFEPVLAGRILGDERLLSAAGECLPPEARGIGMVFQDLALLPQLTALENVQLGLHRLPRRERGERARAMLALVGLRADEWRTYPHQLSGGQQQRVALARALAPKPGLLLLDEPFSSLDLDLRERLSQEVRRILQHEGMTALLVTHSQHEAFAMADRIGVLGEGRLRQWDSAYNLYHRPADRFVADFIGEGALVPGERLADGSIRIELGQVAARNAAGTAPGPVQVLLRPDDVVHDDASPVQATVLHKAFRGAEILYTLRLDSGTQLLSLVPSHHNHALGGKIGIRLDLEHVVTFDVARDTPSPTLPHQGGGGSSTAW
ncbi:MAG TPA: ABC transporter ATP-binding protein [Nevskiales bacterium]|nr:ABC transporter ATP-binding protein [Nevskiales bacterium]